jgi:ribosomal protein L11 methyltransferase
VNVWEVSVRADAEGAEALAAAFNEYAYGGAVIEQTVTPEPDETIDPARPFTVRAFLLSDDTLEAKRRVLEEAVWHLHQLRPLGQLSTRELEEADWAEAWKKFYTILHIGERTVIKPSWLEYSSQPGEIVIELDPGMAFGTGLHPTTRLCLAALEKYIAPGVMVLDIGTGSGILAIAAAKLGARIVEARDIDPIAVETAQKNVELNHVTEVVHVGPGTIAAEGTSIGAGLIAANILAETIAQLAPAFEHHLASRGILVASGILAEKADIVVDALRLVGLEVVGTTQEEDWLVIIGRKGADSGGDRKREKLSSGAGVDARSSLTAAN